MHCVVNLKCENQKQPIGIDGKNPRLSWQIKSTEKNVRQVKYQVSVFQNKTEIWNTGEVTSEDMSIFYQGPALKSRGIYFWKVSIWLQDGKKYDSIQTYWEMGLLEEEDWKCNWISPLLPRVKKSTGTPMDLYQPSRVFKDEDFNKPVYFRKEFFVKAGTEKARIYLTAHGIYNIYLNGKRVSDQELAPECNAYKKFIVYQTYDVTSMLQPDCLNTVAIVVADGWYSGYIGVIGYNNYQYGEDLSMLLQLELEYLDGEHEYIVSDKSFRASFGPYIYAELFKGEKYDANLEMSGWDKSGFNDRDWSICKEVDIPKTNLEAFFGEPVRVVKEIEAKSVFLTPKQELVVDMGQNIAGKFRVNLKGKKGQIISFKCSEMLDKEGNFLQNIMGSNKDQTDIYIMKSEEGQYEPMFTYHGFQYIKVEGYQLNKEDITGLVLGSDMEITGDFSCSDKRINQLVHNISWSQRGNFLSIPTDCPQREKMGWTGDIQVYASTAAFHMDTKCFLERWMRNVRAEACADGTIPVIVPSIPEYEQFVHSSAGWGDAVYIVPWTQYQRYGDEKILEDNYDAMKKWVSYIERCAIEVPEGSEVSENQKYLWNTGFHFGDWGLPSLMPGIEANEMAVTAEKTKEYVTPVFYAYATEIMARIADVIGCSKDAEYYQELNMRIRHAYESEYILDDGRIKGDYQGIYVLVLKFHLVSDEKRTLVLNRLISLLEENDFCLDTGFVSVPFILDVLYENGCADIAYKILFQTKCPSWLYEIEKGANTIWETWKNVSADGTAMNSSYNHYAFGCVGDFIYRRIGGLQLIEPGYKSFKIAPDFKCGLSSARLIFHSVYGKIKVEWKKEEMAVQMNITVPPNTTAHILLPGVNQMVGSGKYCFSVPKERCYENK